MLAHYYRPAVGPDMRGLGIFDAWTIHKGMHVPRCIGNIAIEWNGSTLVGFENHGGRTYLGTARPLGKVLKGYGNNAEDGTEGAVYRHAYGTYLHGSLLPKNPHFADYLLALALQRSFGLKDSELQEVFSTNPLLEDRREPGSAESPGKHNGASSLSSGNLSTLPALDDTLAWEAHAWMLERLGLHHAARAALRRA